MLVVDHFRQPPPPHIWTLCICYSLEQNPEINNALLIYYIAEELLVHAFTVLFRHLFPYIHVHVHVCSVPLVAHTCQHHKCSHPNCMVTSCYWHQKEVWYPMLALNYNSLYDNLVHCWLDMCTQSDVCIHIHVTCTRTWASTPDEAIRKWTEIYREYRGTCASIAYVSSSPKSLVEGLGYLTSSCLSFCTPYLPPNPLVESVWDSCLESSVWYSQPTALCRVGSTKIVHTSSAAVTLGHICSHLRVTTFCRHIFLRLCCVYCDLYANTVKGRHILLFGIHRRRWVMISN